MGWTIAGLAKCSGIGRLQAGRWRERYAVGGLQAIEWDLPRGGRKPKMAMQGSRERIAMAPRRGTDTTVHLYRPCEQR